MPPDLDKYRPYLDEFDLTVEQKAELIHTLWNIMESFADRAFGLHPAQQVGPSGRTGDSYGGADHVDSLMKRPEGAVGTVAGASRRQKDKNEDHDHEGA